LSPGDARLLATGSSDGTARLWDTSTESLLAGPWREDGEVVSVAISPDGRLLAIGFNSSSRGNLEIRDAVSGDLVGQRIRTHAPLNVIAFSPDSKLLAAGTTAGTVQLWDPDTGRRHGPMLRHRAESLDREITALAFSPQPAAPGLLATGSADKTVQLWDVATGAHRGVFLRHEGHVTALAFSPDGKRLTSAATDLSVRFWDTATTGTPALPQTIRPAVAVEALAFSPSGRLLATASVDGSARLWDLETGLACGRPFKHDAVATSLAFSDDERWLASGSFDKTARLWRLPHFFAETDLSRIQLRTWVALGARLGTDGTVEAISWQEWQRLRRELTGSSTE
jgi:WD40 repeat protein